MKAEGEASVPGPGAGQAAALYAEFAGLAVSLGAGAANYSAVL
jgi:hypothetical protein